MSSQGQVVVSVFIVVSVVVLTAVVIVEAVVSSVLQNRFSVRIKKKCVHLPVSSSVYLLRTLETRYQ